MFLFPYENVKKDCNLVIYGAGTMGTDYILQMQRTAFCKIIFALDRAANEKVGFPVNVYTPDYIKKVDSDQYDYVLIAVQDVNHSIAIKKMLTEYGVDDCKIIQAYETGLNCAGFFPKPNYIAEDESPEVLRLSFYAYGGMGDTLIATALIKAIRKIVEFPLVIDYYCNYPEIYRGFPFIDHVFKLTQFSDNYDYDFSAFVFRNINFQKINIGKIKRCSSILYQWCMDMMNTNERICDNFRDDCRYSMYAAMKGKNRIEQHNINEVLPYDRYTPVYMEWDLSAYQRFKKFGLENKRYITISSGIENCNTMRNPKLWEIEKYNQLVLQIKQMFPDILIVSIGQNYNFGKIEGIDIDLVGKTTLNEVKVVLKQSILHIGVEGGLVHLNHFLYGKSCCMFGATSKSFFGYDENININSGFPKQCNNGCEGIVFNWMSYGCFLDHEPICMKMLSVDVVFKHISAYLSGLQQYNCYIIEMQNANLSDINNVLREKDESVRKIAIIDCIEDEVLETFAASHDKGMIFQRDLSGDNKYSNCQYFNWCKKIGVEAEYGNIYNIPVGEEQFDEIINFTLTDNQYSGYALKEFIRVTKSEGRIVLYVKNNYNLREALSFNNISIPDLSQYSDSILMIIRKQKSG